MAILNATIASTDTTLITVPANKKYAITTKTLDFLKNVPRFSYSVNLGAKFGLNGKSTIEDVNNVIQKLGGYDVYMEWFNAGGPKFK